MSIRIDNDNAPESARDKILAYLRRELIGPFEGPNEYINDMPNKKYTMGILFPRETSSDVILEEEDEDGPDTYRVTEWTPLEGSTVAIAADPSVGAGRGFGNPVANEKELKALLNSCFCMLKQRTIFLRPPILFFRKKK